MRIDPNIALVFSTDKGRIEPEKTQEAIPEGDGIVRIHKDSKGRKGKGVTLITGLSMNDLELKFLAKDLKQKCGTGGTVKNRVIEIQGDQRDTLVAELESRGFTVKRVGG